MAEKPKVLRKNKQPPLVGLADPKRSSRANLQKSYVKLELHRLKGEDLMDLKKFSEKKWFSFRTLPNSNNEKTVPLIIGTEKELNTLTEAAIEVTKEKKIKLKPGEQGVLNGENQHPRVGLVDAKVLLQKEQLKLTKLYRLEMKEGTKDLIEQSNKFRKMMPQLIVVGLQKEKKEMLYLASEKMLTEISKKMETKNPANTENGKRIKKT